MAMMSGKRHFRMRIGARKQQSKRIGKTGGDHRFEPRVQGADERGQRASTRTAGGAKPRRVHFRPADQVIDGSLGIPDEVTSQRLAYETGLRSPVDVLIDRPARRRRLELRIVGLLPFALARRVEGQRHETFQRQICRQPLRLGLAFLGVAGL